MEDGEAARPRTASPARRLTQQTTTITVPLKGGDDTPPAAASRGRGRPRKSLEGPKKRSGTPKPGRGGRRKSVVGQMEGKEEDADVWAPTPQKKTRGRPRKSLDTPQQAPQFTSTGTPLRMPEVDRSETNTIKDKASRTRSRQRRQEITPMKIGFSSDNSESPSTGTDIINQTTPSRAKRQALKKSSSTRVLATVTNDSEPASAKAPVKLQRDEAMLDSMIQSEGNLIGANPDVEGSQHGVDPTDEHHDFDTILESEGFSMVSVSSLASAERPNANSAENDEKWKALDDALANVMSPSISPSQHEKSLDVGQDANSGLSKYMPAIASSPSVPPASESHPARSPRALKQPTGGTPKLARIARAGIALQGALSPSDKTRNIGTSVQNSNTSQETSARESRSSSTSIPNSPKERISGLFEGFSMGTRRELRAGLRLGEELAKRQQLLSPKPSMSPQPESSSSYTAPEPTYPSLPSSDRSDRNGVESSTLDISIQYPSLTNNQLPSPDGSVVDGDEDRMSWKVDTPVKHDETPHPSLLCLAKTGGFATKARNLDSAAPLLKSHDYHAVNEVKWQREREAVSREIETASKSQIIEIESDSEARESEKRFDGDNSDIWQAEASTDHSRQTTPETSEVFQQSDIVRPRRSKLPSPWRWNSQFIYNDEIEPTETSSCWRPLKHEMSSGRGLTEPGQADDSTGTLCDRQLGPGKFFHQSANIIEEDTEAAPTKLRDRTALQVKPKSDTQVELSRLQADVLAGNQRQNERTLKAEVPIFGTKMAEVQILEHQESSTMIDPFIRRRRAESKDHNSAPLEQEPSAAVDPFLRNKVQEDILVKTHIVQPTTKTTSWLSRLATPVLSYFTPTTLPPPAIKSDILSSSPYEPLCKLTPWEECHFRALGPLYYAYLFYGPHIFPYNPRSPSAQFCGLTVATALGWSRKVTKADCGVADAFMVLLEERGFALGEAGEDWIEEGLVVRMCVSIWEGMVMKGEIEVQDGDKIGLRVEEDRIWKWKDIDWKTNESAYFERKRRTFDGLPSWKAQGLVWDPVSKSASKRDLQVEHETERPLLGRG